MKKNLIGAFILFNIPIILSGNFNHFVFKTLMLIFFNVFLFVLTQYKKFHIDPNVLFWNITISFLGALYLSFSYSYFGVRSNTPVINIPSSLSSKLFLGIKYSHQINQIFYWVSFLLSNFFLFQYRRTEYSNHKKSFFDKKSFNRNQKINKIL